LCHHNDVAGLVLHHASKNTTGYRGSTAIGAAAELVFFIGREEGDPDPSRRFVRCDKSRPAVEPEPLWFQISAEVDAILLEAAPPAPEHEAPRQARRETVQERLAPQIRDVLRTQSPIRRADIARSLKRPHNDRSVGRVLDRLVAIGEADRTDDFYRLAEPRENTTPASAEANSEPDRTSHQPLHPADSSRDAVQSPDPNGPSNHEVPIWKEREEEMMKLSREREESPNREAQN
jgi:hypothetical protein